MASKSSACGELDGSMQRLEDELRIMRNEPKGMMGKTIENDGHDDAESRPTRAESPVDPRRAPSSRSAPKGLRLHRQQELLRI